MLAHAWAHVRDHPARLAAVLLAVALGTAFLAATAVFTATSAAGLRAVAAAPLSAADVVVDLDPRAEDPGPDWPDRVAARPGIAAAAPYHARTVQLLTEERRATANVYSVAERPDLRWFGLAEGRWPDAPGEVVTDPATADGAGLAVGDGVRMLDAEGEETAATLVGVADLDFRPLTGVQYRLYAPEAYFAGDTPVTALARVADGTAPEDAVASLNGTHGAQGPRETQKTRESQEGQGAQEGQRVLPEGLTAATAQEQAADAADRFAGGSRQIGVVLLAFALVALLASAMVIANTFTILLAQRRRDTALLRLVGADRAQVRTLVVAEAAIVGAAGALAGTAGGAALGYAGAAAMGLTAAGMHASPLGLVGAFLVGTGVTVGAAWFPARRAAATAPVEALRSAALTGTVRFGAVHAVGAVLAVAGAVAMVAGSTAGSVLVGGMGDGGTGAGGTAGASPLATVVGGFAAAVGLLMVLRHPIARCFQGAQWLLRGMGGTAALAGANLARNTGRAATATIALVLGLGLITALTTAAATGRATIDADLRDRYPVDVSARVEDGSVARATLREIASLGPLEQVEAVHTADVRIGPLGNVPLVGVSPEMAEAAGASELATGQSPAGEQDAGGSPPGESAAGGREGDSTTPAMLVSDEQMQELGATEGTEVALTVASSPRIFTLHTSDLAGASGVPAPVVREDVLDSLDVETHRSMVWGVAEDGADRETLADAMAGIAADDPDILVGGALSERADITEALDVMVNLSLAMLLVTVVIATVGVANTLGLSVLERTRESALLRALGLTRAGLRGTLAVEAAVVALLGAALGIVVGVPFGIVGVDAIVGATAPLVVSVPWASLGLVALAASAIGIAASVAPARRAARVAPAEGLSAD